MDLRLLVLLLFGVFALCQARMRASTENEAVMRAEVLPDGEIVSEMLGFVDSSNPRTLDEMESTAEMELDAAVFSPNPCSSHVCEAGQMCQLDWEQMPECVCVPDCPAAPEPAPVCSDRNETFSSACELYRQRCRCQAGECPSTSGEHASMDIEYMAACQEIAQCGEEELSDFSRRMSEWLFVVMRELAERNTLAERFRVLERKAVRIYEERDDDDADSPAPPHPILWKFCDLDRPPSDRYISRAELLELKRPLIAMESCIVPFLDDCDSNDDHKLSLVEWGECLDLPISQVEDICNIHA